MLQVKDKRLVIATLVVTQYELELRDIDVTLNVSNLGG